MTDRTTYLRRYPIDWPIISVKNYQKDVDGWWNWCPKKRARKNKVELLEKEDESAQDESVQDESGNFRFTRLV